MELNCYFDNDNILFYLSSKFSHPNIVEFLGVSVEKNAILLVLEYMPGGDLKNYLRNLRSGQVCHTVKPFSV